MNEIIQVDGKLYHGEGGAIDCRRVVIVPGKLINILTKPHDPDNWVRIVQEENFTQIEGKGELYEAIISHEPHP